MKGHAFPPFLQHLGFWGKSEESSALQLIPTCTIASIYRKYVGEFPSGNASTSSKVPNKTSGLGYIRQFLSTTCLLKQALELVSGDRRESTTRNYESARRKFCSRSGELDPFWCDLKFVLNFLVNLLHQEYEYNTINLHRSPILSSHDQHESLLIGKHPKVKILMAEI